MTKISLYPEISVPDVDDLLIGTDVESSNKDTKNFTIQSISDLIVPYKIYNAILTQEDTYNPVATVLQNTLEGVVVWTRDAEGIYLGTLSGAFPTNKTLVQAINSAHKLTDVNNSSSNAIEITTRSLLTGDPTDGFTKMSVEIKVYE